MNEARFSHTVCVTSLISSLAFFPGMISTYKPHADKDKEECDPKAVTLEPNHSHFVLVHDADKDKEKFDAFGAELPLRALLEDDLARDNDKKEEDIAVPMIVICVSGTYGTLEGVMDAVANDRPVVVLPESGHAAKWIYDWCCKPDLPKDEYMQKVLPHTQALPVPAHARFCLFPPVWGGAVDQ